MSLSEFSVWLSSKLNYLGLDETVFSSYVTGILQGDESPNEKIEALEEVLTDSKDESTTAICREIIEKWSIYNKSDDNAKDNKNDDFDQKLSQLLESNVKIDTNNVPHNSQYTDEQFKIRQAILSQYSGNDVDVDDDDLQVSTSDLTDLGKNTNALAIHQAEKEKREKAKIESQKKKEKDKEDREKQKKIIAEKKEAKKKKAQKVERRRM